jgi:CelD/BcsL family acetyltransferase involved in cellulose biosynthesis
MNTIVEVKNDWLQILPNASVRNIFLTPQFQEVWWQNFGKGECFILRIENDQKELLGIAPFFFHEGALQFLGDVSVSDYLDFIIVKGKETEFYSALTHELKQTSFSWKTLSLSSVPDNSPTLSLFSELAQKENWSVNIQEQNICPVLSLPSSWEEYLQSIGKKQRHEIKRKWKNVEEKVQPTFTVITGTQEMKKNVDDFIRLHKLSSAKKAEFWNDKQTQYFQELITTCAENSWLKLFFLEIEGERVATMLCFDYENQFYLYNSGYDPSKFAGLSLGSVLTAYTIKHAIELGRNRYDFLRGDEEYKFRYGAKPESIFDIKISR